MIVYDFSLHRSNQTKLESHVKNFVLFLSKLCCVTTLMHDGSRPAIIVSIIIRELIVKVNLILLRESLNSDFV